MFKIKWDWTKIEDPQTNSSGKKVWRSFACRNVSDPESKEISSGSVWKAADADNTHI